MYELIYTDNLSTSRTAGKALFDNEKLTKIKRYIILRVKHILRISRIYLYFFRLFYDYLKEIS